MDTKASNTGIQAWSVGETYPIAVVGYWDGRGPTKWRAENLHTGEFTAVLRDTYKDTTPDVEALLALHRRKLLRSV